MRELERLRKFEHKYILIQQSYAEFLNPNTWKGIPYAKRWQAMAVVESWLISMTQTENIHFIFIEERHSSKVACKILLKTYEWRRKKIMQKEKELEDAD